MQQFPNYSMNPQMNPYQNNFNQTMPMQNPYMDRMNQLQNYQQSLQQPQIPQSQPQGLIGKVVNDFAEITANDVPMNGVSAVFPKADLSEVQLRTWTANGTIQAITYKPILEQNPQESTNILQNDFTALNEGINAFREEILSRLDSIEKLVAKPNSARNKKAEVNADE